MFDKMKLKKTIAKEVLLFFATLFVLALIMGLLYLRNVQFIIKSNSLNDELNTTKSKLDKLPNDQIKALYEGVSPYLVMKYQLYENEFGIPIKEGTTLIYAVPKKEEQRFLKDYPSAKSLQATPNGYSKGLPIFPNDPIGTLNDSIFEFDFVTLDKFKEFLKNKDYKNKFYISFSNEFELGDTSFFYSKIKEGLSYTVATDIERNELINKISQIKRSIYNAKKSIFTDKKIVAILFYTALVFIIILYPIRLCYLLLKWALLTVRKSDTHRI
jgi:hypothetical protein